MAKEIWSKFFWQNWLSDPGLRRCSLSARGLWMDMLCVAAEHTPIGYVAVNGEGLSEDDLARISGSDPTSVATLIGELERNGVFSRNRDGVVYSRKMVRDAKKKVTANQNLPPSCKQTENQPLGGNALASGSWTLEDQERSFEEFWKAYPRREGPNPKHMAQKSFLRAAESEAIGRLIIAGAKRFASAESKNIGTPYIAQAVTWLNQRRWEDYPVPANLAESMENTWRFLLEREKQTGSWPSRQILKSDIPAEFIAKWGAGIREPAE